MSGALEAIAFAAAGTMVVFVGALVAAAIGAGMFRRRQQAKLDLRRAAAEERLAAIARRNRR